MPANTANPETSIGNAAEQRTRWAWLVGTGLGIGHLRPPGTWASAATVALWWLVASALPPSWLIPAGIAAASIVVLVGIPAATIVARESGREDPQVVVVDEIAGQFISLIGVALSWKAFLAALVLFRIFDILKPPPVRQLERMAGGAGIMLDDVMAGLYARLGLAALFYFGLLT